MKSKGVKSCCCNSSVINFGRYKRTSDGQWVQRYQCKTCRKTFSKASFEPEYRQKRRDVNHKCMMLLASNVSMRRTAMILGIHPITVARKLMYLSSKYKSKVFSKQDLYDTVKTIQFDELHTIEHTKCKPVAVAMAVSKDTRKILGFSVSKMPASGHLAAISRRKYGVRKNERLKGLHTLFDHLKEHVKGPVHFQSDECRLYDQVVQSRFPGASYEQFKGKKGCISGQGELKKVRIDPLFTINHTFAMLRANINRLIRRTWNTTKKLSRLFDHLILYCWVHNLKLT